MTVHENPPVLPPIREQLIKAFLAGFACSLEGFNGECAYPHLAPDSIPTDKEIGVCRNYPELMVLAKEAADFIGAGL